jgi:ABC-type nitrate/sulfonate/bicarbonate transport system permease component
MANQMNRSVLIYFILPGILLFGWVLFSLLAPQDLDIIFPFLFNSSNSVVDAFKTLLFGYGTFFQKLDLFRHLLYSLIKVICGYCAALLIGIPLGILMGWRENVGRFFYPIIEIIRPIPPIAWIPCAILWFTATRPDFFPGIYYAGFIIFIGSFFPILLNTTAGVRGMRRLYIDAAKSMGANEAQLLIKVIIPGALPSIVTGMRIGMGVGWMCLVGAEIVNAQYGLGYITVLGMRLYDLGLITSGMIMIGLMGISIDRGFRYFEDRFLPWRGK